EALAKQTWNPRLGILGGISILGTTGIVHPFSCSAWIHSIHRGIDVSRANNIKHVLGATGSTSENGADKIYNFTDEAMLDMGDFAGGLLKYLKNNPIENLTLAGGFAKFTKLAQGALDLHSGRSQVDLDWLAKEAKQLGLNDKAVEEIKNANTAMEALQIATEHMPKDKTPLEHHIANLARQTALDILQTKDHKNKINVEVMIFSRDGKMLARVGELNL
ncbi:MAG: cobalt-precorrin-5B (C(1))-methyltransferase CbiD, partial [Nitratireductor sp.]